MFLCYVLEGGIYLLVQLITAANDSNDLLVTIVGKSPGHIKIYDTKGKNKLHLTRNTNDGDTM